MISEDKKTEFDKEYSEELYRIYNNRTIDDSEARNKLKKLVSNKKVLLIGPGKSSLDYNSQIEEALSQDNIFSIAINGNDLYYTNATFYSNKKRYNDMTKRDNLILITSNIKANQEADELIFDYNNSLSREYGISDNALLIMLNILKDMDANEILLIGFDGFSTNMRENFYSDDKTNVLTKEFINQINEMTTNNIKEYSKKIKIKSLTPTKYIGGLQ